MRKTERSFLELVKANLDSLVPDPYRGMRRISAQVETRENNIALITVVDEILPFCCFDYNDPSKGEFWNHGGQLHPDINVVPSYYSVDRESNRVSWYYEAECL